MNKIQKRGKGMLMAAVKYLQKLGKSIMLPVACLPLSGILMGIGYLLCPASMQGGDIAGAGPVIGMFLVKAGGALIDHIALLFAVGIGVGMSDDQNGTAGITALVSWLIITTLLRADFVRTLVPSLANQSTALLALEKTDNPFVGLFTTLLGANSPQPLLPSVANQSTTLLAFEKIENPFIGILAGLIGAESYNRFKNTSLPEWLAFFSRRRSTVIMSGLISIAAAALLFFVWPVLFGGLVRLGQGIAGLGAVGAGLYAFLNRLLIPLGLHHALNNVFWFDTIGLGDLTHFWAGHTSADVTWSLGMYMSGFFPCMMFGVPGAALAMIRSAKTKRRKYAVGILASAALCAFACGITEPFEFAFMFAAPALYAAYALLYGVFTYVTALTGFRAGFSFSAGATDLLFSASLPAARDTWLILPLGAAAFAAFYFTFRVMIRKLHLNTPGNEADLPPEGEAAPEEQPERGEDGEADCVAGGVNVASLLRGLGGAGNILSLDSCATRLRLEVRDAGQVQDAALKKAGARGVVRLGDTAVQVIIGLKVQAVADALREKLRPGA